MNEKIQRVLLNLKYTILKLSKKKTKVLMLSMIILLLLSTITIVNPQTSEVFSNQSEWLSVSADTKVAEPYDYIEPRGYGTFGYYKVNETFFRDWLNNTVTWRVEKSTDDITWKDYTKFEVKKDWDSYNLSEKHTIIVDADEEAYYKISTSTKSDKQLVDYVDDSKNTSFSMRFKVSESKDYTLLYNWSDYSKSPEASKTVLSKSVKTDVLSSKQYFEWAVTSSVKLKAGEQFVLDPVYGTIGDVVTDSWEWDTEEGVVYNPNSLLKVGSDATYSYFVTSASGDTGTDNDGFLRTFRVFNSNGTIEKNLISKWEYDTSDGSYAGIFHISGDVYAVIYNNIVFTTTIWSSNGTCKQDTIDTITLTYTSGEYPSLIHVINDVYACVYTRTTAYDTYIETINITSSGIISATVADTFLVDATSASSVLHAPSACMIDSDTIAVLWQVQSDKDLWLATVNISSTGNIEASTTDTWEMDTRGSSSSSSHGIIFKISGNVFCVAYSDGDDDNKVCTIAISNDGKITKTLIDSLTWDSDWGRYFCMVTINDASTIAGGVGVYAFTTHPGDVFNSAKITTINISSDGTIPASSNDELYISNDNYASPIVYVSGNYYLIVNSYNSDNDGWAYTFTIETYEAPEPGGNTNPTQSNNNPINNTGCNDLNPKLTIFVYDDNGNTMNITWMSNSSGSWIEFGSNLSITNGTYNMSTTNFSSCNTTYFWSVNLSDGNGGYNNMTYYLRTAGPTNIVIFSPANESINVELTPILKIYANNTCGKLLNIYWYENSTGDWMLMQSNLSVPSNTTYQYLYTGANDFNTTYGWMVAVNSTTCNVSQTCTFRTYQEPATHIALYGLTDFWNMTWSANEDNATGVVPEIVYTNDSGINYETMIINCIVNSTERISNVTITHDELNLSTDYATKLYANNITVWVSANGGDFFIPNCDLGYGRGRFTPTGGSINLNVTSWDGANSPFSDYYNGTNNAISENCTILVRLQLNVTMDTPHGYFVNQTYLSGGSPYIYAYNYSGIYSEIIYFTSQARIYGNAMNYGVVLSHPNPANNSVGNPLSFTWNITAEDPNGDNFDWSIECYGLNNNGVGDVNGSKTLVIVVPNWCTNYTVYVNATDGINFTTEYFYFTTQSMPNATLTNPIPANGSTNTNYSLLNWTIDINSPAGEWFDYTIECVGQTRSGNDKTNNTFNVTIIGLQQATTYTVYVNVTNNCSNATSAWYTFTTKTNDVLVVSHENPANKSTSQELELTVNVTIEDPNGDLINWSIECFGQSNSAILDVNGSKTLVVTGLNWCSNYSWYVNTTDSNGGIVNNTYWFLTRAIPNVTISNPIPANGSTGQLLNFNYSIDLTNPAGELFNMTIQCNNSQVNYTNLTLNGTYYLNLTGLSFNTQYTIWVNVTNNCSNETRVWFTFTTRENHAPIVHHEYPANKTVNYPVGDFVLNATIEDPDGDTFSYYWHCTNGDSNSAVGNTNGSKTFMLSGPLDFCTNYTLYVNATDGNMASNYTFWFVTRPMASCLVHNPNPANNSLGNLVWFTWNVTIESPNGTTFDWTIECYGNTNSGNADTNGSKTLSIVGLDYCTNYTVYVNTTNDCSNDTHDYFYFTTTSSASPDVHNPNPVNNSVGNELAFTWNVTINQSQGETFQYWIECNNGQSDSATTGNLSATIALTGLEWCTNYTVWVNATTECLNYSNMTYHFTTKAMSNVIVSNPNPANNSVNIGLAFNFSVDVESPNGEWFDIDITCNNSDTNSSSNCVNDTYYLNITGLSYSTIYVVWVNTTNNCSNETRVWFTFTTIAEPVAPTVNYNPNQSSPFPNGSICQSLTEILEIFVYDDNANDMNISWFSNSSGTWIEFDVNLTVGNGTYNQTNSNFSSPCTTYYWSVNLSDGVGGWNNITYSFKTACCPTIHLSYVVNESTGTSMQPIMIIYTNDSCGLPLVVDFYQNTSGTWEHNQTNNTAANQTVYWNYTNASTNSHTYYWRVTINNSYCNVSYTYWFTTAEIPPAVMIYLDIDCLYPINNSIIVNSSTGIPTCVNITLHNAGWEPYILTFYSNSSGAWIFFGNLTIVHNGSYCIFNTNFTGLNDIYYWNVSVYNASVINTSSVFKFTTNSSFVMAGVERDMFNYLPFLLFSVIFYIMYERRKRRKR